MKPRQLPTVSAEDVSPHGVPHHTDADESGGCVGCARFDRRGFLTHASLLGLGALVTAACGDGIISGPSEFPSIGTTSFRVDPNVVSSLGQVGSRAIVATPEGGTVLVERIGAKQFRGISLTCPHLGSTVDVQSSGFTCPNHGARFSADGAWIGGQSTSDLNAIAVVLQPDGSLLVGGIYVPPAPPALAVSTTSVSFTVDSPVVAPAAQTVSITNKGEGTLGGIALSLSYGINQPAGWLTLALSSTSAPATLTFNVARAALPFGTYTALVRITSADTGTSASTVSVTYIVQDPNLPPSLELSTPALAFSAATGSNPAAQSVQVLNTGGGTLGRLVFTIAYGAGATAWLSTSSLSGTTAPAALTIRPEVTNLAAGTYTATVQVTGVGVTARTLTITVTITSAGLAVTIANWPALANVGGVAGSVGSANGLPVAVVRLSATSFVAFSMRCPHQGTQINVVGASSFRCPNHGALFGSNGVLLPNSPQKTGNLQTFKVTYTPGNPILYVS